MTKQTVDEWFALGNRPIVGKPQPYLSLQRMLEIVATAPEPHKAVTPTCAICGQPRSGRQRSRRFCSRSCYGASRQGRRQGGWVTPPPLDWHGRWMKKSTP